jgi:hypothetical protein
VNIDLGSPVLDIAIGLSFVFFLLSVITSALGEGFAGIFNLRGKTLEEGLLGMIGYGKVVEDLLDHDLVRTELDKKSRKGVCASTLRRDERKRKKNREYERASSYLSAKTFAVAFAAIYKELREKVAHDEATPAPDERTDDQKAAATARKQGLVSLEKQMLALMPSGASGDQIPFTFSLERWFDTSMERVSGWYKRKSQIITLCLAIVVAVGCNASTLRIVERLDKEPSVRAAVVSAAETSTKEPCCGEETKEEKKEQEEKEAEQKTNEETQRENGELTDGAAEIEEAGSHLSEATKKLDDLHLPLFWGPNTPSSATDWLTAFFGWILTVIAISLGAPFWFDTLGKLSNLRSTGPKPGEKEK